MHLQDRGAATGTDVISHGGRLVGHWVIASGHVPLSGSQSDVAAHWTPIIGLIWLVVDDRRHAPVHG